MQERIQVVWETGIPVWALKLYAQKQKKHGFQQKKYDQWFHNASDYFEMAQNTKIQTEEKNVETKRSKRKEKLSTKVFSSHSDHASIRFLCKLK